MAALVGAVLIAGCSDNPLASRGPVDTAPYRAILDAPRGGQPEFFWLRPTVATAPSFSGTFDASALSQLAVEVCLINGAGSCIGDVERYTSTTGPLPSRLTLDATGQFNEMRWLTNRPAVKAGQKHRISALRGTALLGYRSTCRAWGIGNLSWC